MASPPPLPLLLHPPLPHCRDASNQSYKKQFLIEILFFTAFEIYRTVILQRSLAFTIPHLVDRKLTNAMILEQFSDLLESYVSCDKLVVAGDPSTSALNVVLDNLSLQNRATDVLGLTVFDIFVTARVWCRGGIDRKRNSTINLTTDSGACYWCLPQTSPLTPDVTTNNFFTVQRGTPKYIWKITTISSRASHS